MEGIAIGGIAAGAGEEMTGLGIGLFAAGAGEKARGVLLGGLTAGAGERVSGIAVSLIRTEAGDRIDGVAIGGVLVAADEVRGITIGAFNGIGIHERRFKKRTNQFTGVAIGGLNFTRNLHGVQIGVLNYAGNKPVLGTLATHCQSTFLTRDPISPRPFSNPSANLTFV